MDTHTHTCAGTCTEQRVRHPAWQACMRLCVEGSDTGLPPFFLYIKPQRAAGKRGAQRKCGAVGRLLSRYCTHLCSAARFNSVCTADKGLSVGSGEKSPWCLQMENMLGSCLANMSELFKCLAHFPVNTHICTNMHLK